MNFIKLPKLKINPQFLGKLKVIFLVSFSTLALLGLIFGFYSVGHANKIYPQVKISGLKVGGLTKSEATAKITEIVKNAGDNQIQLQYQVVSQTVNLQELNLQYNPEISVESAYLVGREPNWPQRMVSRLKSLFNAPNLNVAFQFDKGKYNELVETLTNKINIAEQDATCLINSDTVSIVTERTGQRLMINKLREDFIDAVGQLKQNPTIMLIVESFPPLVTSEEAELTRETVQAILSKSVVLQSISNEKIWLAKQEIAGWLEFVAKPKNQSANQYFLDVQLNQEKIKQYLTQLAGNINRDAQDAKLTIASGKAVVWQKSQDGYSLNIDEAVKLISGNLLGSSQVAGLGSNDSIASNQLVVKLPIEVKKPTITEVAIDNLGIKELIATGTTSFKGSPTNRKYNIKLGSELFNGAIIKPGEEFSFLQNLGAVSEARGFKKELVIKEDSTVPEVGGGLCQVSTTMFRAALNAGLKITERTNHKYRVSYYEPPVGLDATIYDPSPDLKFVNDTPGYILIQSSISGNNLTFEFYGTKDGREVSISSPALYDYENPPAPLYIDDSSLAPGEEKYKEKAHQGVKAKVSYTVKRAGEIINQQVFYSKYTAWGAVILRGPGATQPPQPDPNPVPAPTASETPVTEPSSSPSPEPSPTPTPTVTVIPSP